MKLKKIQNAKLEVSAELFGLEKLELGDLSEVGGGRRRRNRRRP
ncbi:MAG: hypothetical protein AAF316_09370 [Cyanobacteria bacterium P01_A01_bin.80]